MVNFAQSAYTVNESSGSVEVSLLLSSPASIDINVRVFGTDGSATGEIFIVYAHQCCDMEFRRY